MFQRIHREAKEGDAEQEAYELHKKTTQVVTEPDKATEPTGIKRSQGGSPAKVMTLDVSKDDLIRWQRDDESLQPIWAKVCNGTTKAFSQYGPGYVTGRRKPSANMGQGM